MKNEVTMKPFPENLFDDLRYQAPDETPDDFIGTFMYVLYTVAPTRDVKAMIMRYRNGKSYDEIAEALGVSRQRAHAVIQEVLGRMTTEHAEMLAKGMRRYMDDVLADRAEQIAGAVSAEERDALRAEAYTAGLRAREAGGDTFSDFSGVVIETLGLTTRTYNSFARNDLRTLADILNVGDKIMSMKSFGKGCFYELVSVLDSLNLDAKTFYPMTIAKYGTEAEK